MERSTLRMFGARCRFIGLVVIGLVVTGAPAFAGQSTAASIIGQAKDDSGAVLPGVTVVATSPALQVPQISAVTNEQGEYRLSPLPIGVYRLAFDLQGFRPVRQENIRLTVGFTAKIDVVLAVASVEETITVTARTPVVDVASTSGSTLLTKEMLELTPTSRNGAMSLLTMAPGVRSSLDVGGNAMVENPNARAFGQGGAAWYTLEGVSTNMLNPGGGSASFWDYQTIDEARVQTLGTDAEFPTRGVQINGIVKSGGNQFHGAGVWAQTNHNFQNNNIDDTLAAQGITSGNALENQYDVSGDLGGRIVRDRLWFYGAARKRGQEYQVLQAFKPDGSPANDLANQRWFTGKLSYQPTPSNRFVGFLQESQKIEDGGTNELVSYESRAAVDAHFRYGKAEWQGLRGNSLVASVQFGYSRYFQDTRFNTPGGSIVGRSDIATEEVSGEPVTAGERTLHRRNHTRGAVTWFKPNSFHGNHELKAGFDYSAYLNYRSNVVKPVNYHLLFEDGQPFQLAFFNTPVQPRQTANNLGIYLKDRWTIGRRLTLNVGVRYENDDAAAQEVCREAAAGPSDVIFPAECFPKVQLPVWHNVAPRLHAAYDLSGDGKTIVKGGWGRYDHMRLTDPEALRLARAAVTYGIFTWHDLNRNANYDDGEVDRSLNGPDFVQTTGLEFNPAPSRFVVNPDEKLPKVDEFSLSIERELIRDFALRVTGLYSRWSNVYRLQNNLRPFGTYNIPVTNPDPGPDGLAGNADDGAPVTYFEFAPSLTGAKFEEFMPINDSSADPDYRSIELSATKRMANRWQFMASYSATKKNRPIISTIAVTGFNEPHEVGSYNPNAEINQSDRTWDWDAKFLGAYVFPAEILLSANLQQTSGDAFARQVLFRGGVTIPSIVLNVEPIGSQRLPTVSLLTIAVEKDIHLSTQQRVKLRLNVYNALNANTSTAVQPRAGAQFLRPRSILPPRIAEVSVSYTF